jgi:hypothetical protein
MAVRGALALAVLACVTAFGIAAPATVQRVSGVVERRAPGMLEWQAVSPGDKIDEGSTIRTQANASAELRTPRGHQFQLRANTSLELTSIQDDETKTRLESGRVVSKVKHLKGEERFLIQTPTAVCAVRGTEFETSSSDHGTTVAVYKGIVGVSAMGSGAEMALTAGQMVNVHDGTIEIPHPIPPQSKNAADSALARTARHEVGLDMTRNEVMAAAAQEQRLAEYQEGKSLIDVEGKRVRLDEYILRPRPDTYKFVVLNQRDTRFDYFYYQGTFNKNLPTDLSVALRNLPGTVGTAPDYYLTGYETGQSNTQDSVHDTATGGHLVKIVSDGQGNYVLSDPADPTNTHTVAAATLQTDGTYKLYNPLTDSYTIATAAQKDAVSKLSVYIPENDSYRDLAPTDTAWRTRFNTYTHQLDNVTKIAYSQSGLTNVLATNLDASYTYAGGFVLPVTKTDPLTLDTTITNYYGDGTFEMYRTVFIDDLGKIAPQSAFEGLSTGASFKNELLKWNYEQQVSASEFHGRKIDLVVEPKIFIKSGLIQ